MVDARQIDSGTLAWYLEWLSERNPEWTDEQRLEIATGFVTTQLPPERPVEIEEEPITNVLDLRAADRKTRRYLTGKELMEILQTPGAIPKVS
jgi:hypothetical protein